MNIYIDGIQIPVHYFEIEQSINRLEPIKLTFELNLYKATVESDGSNIYIQTDQEPWKKAYLHHLGIKPVEDALFTTEQATIFKEGFMRGKKHEQEVKNVKRRK